MLIALIDDGVDAGFCGEIALKYDMSVDADGSVRPVDPDDRVLTIHGTTCAMIIHKYAPEAELCSLRIFHEETLHASCQQLMAALEWCADAKIPIVHMSVGSSAVNDYWKLRPIIARMLRQRQVIVAAFSNEARLTIPACIGGVIGVTADEGLVDNDYFFYDGPYGTSIAASSKHDLEVSPEINIATQVTNSFAAPTVTAAVHGVLSCYEPLSVPVPQIMRMLAGERGGFTSHKPDFIEKAVIVNPFGYPILKQLLFFECIGETADIPAASGSGQYDDIVYLASPVMEENDSAIALLSGYFDNTASLVYCGTLREDSCLYRRDGFIWSEGICHEIQRTPDDAERTIDTPIINVCGKGLTAIEVTCRLRELFIKADYQCVSVGDHPFSYLYGFEYIPETSDSDTALAFFNRYYTPDIIIYCSSYDDMTARSADDYYIITDMQSERDTAIEGDADNVYRFSMPVDDNSISALYDGIMRHFGASALVQ